MLSEGRYMSEKDLDAPADGTVDGDGGFKRTPRDCTADDSVPHIVESRRRFVSGGETLRFVSVWGRGTSSVALFNQVLFE